MISIKTSGETGGFAWKACSRWGKGKGDLVATTGFLVALGTSAIGVTVLHPVVVHVVKVVKVLLLGAGVAEDIAGVHAWVPAIVFASGLEKVSIVAVEDGLEVPSADTQVGGAS